MAYKFENPWAPGGEYFKQNALHTQYLPDGFLDTTMSYKEWKDGNNKKEIFINNKSNKTIYYKPEEGSNVKSVAPKSVSYEPLDGLVTHKYCNKVYKVFTGATVEIDINGNIDPDYYGVGDLVNLFAGGWKGVEWLKKIQNNGDNSWDALFEKSKEICK